MVLQHEVGVTGLLFLVVGQARLRNQACWHGRGKHDKCASLSLSLPTHGAKGTERWVGGSHVQGRQQASRAAVTGDQKRKKQARPDVVVDLSHCLFHMHDAPMAAAKKTLFASTTTSYFHGLNILCWQRSTHSDHHRLLKRGSGNLRRCSVL